MVKKTRRKSISRQNFRKYHSVAKHFYDAAADSMDLEYWTAAGVLIVHAAIAYADALCIKSSGIKSSGDDHEDAVILLENAVPEEEGKSKAINHLKEN